jgi:MOSC domain-containing protein YiiM
MAQDEQAHPWETPPELWRGLRSSKADWRGRVVSIFIAPKAAAEMVSVAQVRAVTDRGLEGDRFFRDSWSALNRPDKAVTFIEEETLDIAATELGVESLAQKSRRNIVTRGAPLVELLHREFTVGSVRLRGIRLFEPCGHLVRISGLRGIYEALEHRSGLKAAVLSDGPIGVGDPIALKNETQPASIVLRQNSRR